MTIIPVSVRWLGCLLVQTTIGTSAWLTACYMDPPDPLRASPISPQEIRQVPCDYVALGHVHVFRDVSQNGVPAYYSGAPSGSQTKTVAIVDLDPASGVSVSPLQIDLE